MRLIQSLILLISYLLFTSPCLMAEPNLNIVEMRETLSENPYWTKSYNAYGRTVDVNIPIMIPDVDALPIMTVIPHMLFEEETSCKIESIEQEIIAGRIRNIYALHLRNICYLNDNSSESYTLFPTWLCECDYTKTEKEEGSVYILDAGIRDGTKFELLGVNAVTGEVFDRRMPSWNSLYSPSMEQKKTRPVPRM